MKKIIEDIKQEKFEKIYLLWGEEEYLKRVYKNKFKKSIVDDELSMNISFYDEKSINDSDFEDTIKTYPFFSKLLIDKF